MKEQITLLSQGRQIDRPLRLIWKPERIQEEIAAGQRYRGELDLKEANGQSVKGLLYSSHRRVRLLTEQFAAVNTVAAYEINTEGLEPGTELKGSFQLVTNAGEIEVPFCFRVIVPVGKTAYEKIHTIEAFAELAQQDFMLALQIFENSSFRTLPFMQQPAFISLYQGLYGHGERRLALEEFLAGCGVKEQIRLTIDEKTRTVMDPRSDITGNIPIEKNTWGALQIRVRTDAKFLETEVRTITEESFEGNRYELGYVIHPSLLHGGTNYGRIYITTTYQSFQIDVVVTQSDSVREHKERLDYRAAYQKFFRSYVEMYTRRLEMMTNQSSGTNTRVFLMNGMLTDLARLRETYHTSDWLELFHIEIYLRTGQREKAGLLLADVKERVLEKRREEIDAYCYYYYLRAMYSQSEEDQDQLVKILRFYHEGEHPSQTVFFLLLLADGERRENPLRTMEEMKDLYTRGCRSPFLYLAACRMYRAQPLLLSAIGEFELQALAYGARKDMLNLELAVRVAMMSENERVFRAGYYRLILQLAKKFDDPELVTAVCRILILGEKKGAEFFPWYERGVKQDIRLTRLYEYYMYSLPQGYQGKLPQEIYLYFSMANTLDEKSRGVLYANVLREFEEGSQTYDSFAGQMGAFAREQVLAGRISEDLALIYEKMIPAAVIDGKLAAAFPRLLYCTRISCDQAGWDQVILSYEEMEKEETALLREGCAIVSMYSERCRVLFQDRYGNRYAGGSHSSRRILQARELEQRCCELNPLEPYLLMHRCEMALDEGRLDEKALALYEQVLGLSSLRDCFRRILTSRIVTGSITAGKRENSPKETAGERLMRISDRNASREDALRMMEIFIDEDFSDRAFSMIERYGYEEIKPSALLKLCSRTCVSRLFARDELLLRACYTCMEQDRADDVVLEYLCRHYNGTSGQMLRVLLQGEKHHVNLYDLPERLLGQMLFTGAREGIDEVFAIYESEGQMDELLLNAYLVQKCYDFLNMDVAVDAHIFDYVEKKGDQLPLLCRIALCRYEALMPDRTEEQIRFCLDTIRYCCDRNMVFDFFTAFAAEDGYPLNLRGKMVISLRGKADERLRIRYRILPDQDEFRDEVLPHMYQGYFSKELTVFYGETVEYEIYRDQPEGPVLLTKNQLTAEAGEERTDRMGKLNRILRGMETMDEAMLRREMRDYSMTEALIEHYFDII